MALSINHHIQSYNSNAENGEAMLIDNPAEFSQNNFEGDDEFNVILDELIADENGIITHPYSTPLLNNSVFNTNNKKRARQASSNTQRKFQRKNPDDDGLIDLINEVIDDDGESHTI